MRDAVSRVSGVVDLSLEQQMDIPVVRFVLNRTAIAQYGLHASDVGEAIETSFAGATVGRIFDRGAAFDLIVKEILMKLRSVLVALFVSTIAGSAAALMSSDILKNRRNQRKRVNTM